MWKRYEQKKRYAQASRDHKIKWERTEMCGKN